VPIVVLSEGEFSKVEHVLESIGELIAARQVRVVVAVAIEWHHEALLDQCQHRGVITDRMRYMVRLGEGRYGP